MSFNNPFAEAFKSSVDFNQVFSTQRRNLEAASAATQAAVEGAQAIARRQTEIARDGVEAALKASKELLTSGTPETNLAKQAEVTKSFFEATLANLREVSEMATKASFEVFDVLNQRAAASFEEITKATGATAKKK